MAVVLVSATDSSAIVVVWMMATMNAVAVVKMKQSMIGETSINTECQEGRRHARTIRAPFCMNE
jgi:hypothetical protein